MIPETLGAVLAFLVFIAPGLLWELLRERARPPLEGSPFREASRVALMSVVLSGASICALATMRALIPSLFLDPGALLRRGDNYVNEEYGRIAWTVGLELGIACILAWIPWRWPKSVAWLRVFKTARHPSGVVNTDEPVLWSVLFGSAAGESLSPTDQIETHVIARHTDGYTYLGRFLAIDHVLPRHEAYLTLQTPIRIRAPGHATSSMPPGFDRVVLPLSELSDLWIVRQEPETNLDPA